MNRKGSGGSTAIFPTFSYEIIAILWLCRAASFVRCPSPQQGRQHLQPAQDRIAPQTLSTMCVCVHVCECTNHNGASAIGSLMTGVCMGVRTGAKRTPVVKGEKQKLE